MFTPYSDHNTIPAAIGVGLTASSTVTKGNFITVNLSTGYGAENDGATPNRFCVGIGDVAELTESSTIAGAASAIASWRMCWGIPASTVSNDGFAVTDWGTPFWQYDASTPGKLSHTGTVGAGTIKNRSLGGLVFGLDKGTPVLWSNPIATLLARATLMTDAKVGAWHRFDDAAASTTTSETAIHREKLHGVVTAVEFIGAACAAASDYATITIKRYDSAGANGVTVATYDTRAATTGQGAITAFSPAAFALSGTAAYLNLLETDVLTITVTKGSSGQQLIGTVRVLQKVI
jgi:hypothetical protein